MEVNKMVYYIEIILRLDFLYINNDLFYFY